MKKEHNLSLITKSWIWQKITVRWPWSQFGGLKCLWNVAFPYHQMTAAANRHILSCSTTFLPLTSAAAIFLPGGASGVFRNRFLTQAAFTFPINISQEARFCLKLVLEAQPISLQSCHTCSNAHILSSRARIKHSKTYSSAGKSQLQKFPSFVIKS